jgi:hypothetical protein
MRRERILVSREFEVETGSIGTASATTQSHVLGNFPAAGAKPPDGGMRRERLVSVTRDLDLEGSLRALFSGLEFPFPGNGDCDARRRKSGAHSATAQWPAGTRLPALFDYGDQLQNVRHPRW